MIDNKYEVNWEEILDRLYFLSGDLKGKKVFGIPKGGMLLAALMSSYWNNTTTVLEPEKCDVILDDIYDSGLTAKRYEKYNKKMYFIFDKRKEFQNTWLVLPYENDSDIPDYTARILQYLNSKNSDLVKKVFMEVGLL